MSKVQCFSTEKLKSLKNYESKNKFIEFEKKVYNQAWDDLLLKNKAEVLIMEIKSLESTQSIDDKLNLTELIIRNAKELAEAIYRRKP